MPPKKIKKSQFEPRDLVLAKMHGFPAWPSFVMPEDMVPDAILRAKKKTTNYCVIFIPDGDFYWMSDKNLEPLSEDKLDTKLEKIPNKNKPKKKTGGRTLQVTDALLATKGLDFDEFMEKLDTDRNQDNDEDEQEVEGYEDEEKYEESETSDLKAQDVDEDEDDQAKQDSQSEDDTTERDRRSRRKRSMSVNGKRKNFKTSSTPTASAQSEYSNGSNKTKLEGSPKLTDEEKQHQLWLCRIKLQRSLIQRNQPVTPENPKQFPPPTANELLVARLILHRLVEFPVDLELLKKTKIHKVLKCILRDKDLEYPDSFKLHEKCDELLTKWSPIIDNLKQEKLKEPSGHNNSSSSTSALTDLKANGSRPGSLAPDESEISALENVTNETIKKEPTNSNSDYHDKGELEDSEDINESVTNDVSVIS